MSGEQAILGVLENKDLLEPWLVNELAKVWFFTNAVHNMQAMILQVRKVVRCKTNETCLRQHLT